MAELKKSYMSWTEEDEDKLDEKEAGRRSTVTSSRSPMKKKQVDTWWEETLQKFSTAQELGSNLITTVPMVTQLLAVRLNCF